MGERNMGERKIGRVAAASIASNAVSEANNRNAPVVANIQGDSRALPMSSGHSLRDSLAVSEIPSTPNEGATNRAATLSVPKTCHTALINQNNKGGLWLYVAPLR